MLEITPAMGAPVTKITCPACNEKIPRLGLLPGSKIEGLTFKCKRCGKLWEIKTE
jgi:transposase